MKVPSSFHDRNEIDVPMTPMIDVVFQLLIFFICTASFQMPEMLLPTSVAAERGASAETPTEVDPTLEQIVVRGAHSDGRTEWIVNDRLCSSIGEVQQVLHAVAEIDRSLPVILDVAPAVPLGDMIDVYDMSRIVGFEKIQIAAER